ncbi:unnamed protein product [Meganyctiphanes norvegica]|uniref:Uncharacterized protein n=1 Tax=Meganyctiphanes norvegica TaxID=48144 RepID=A0AAV2RXZ5_MEGNR
MCRINGLIHLLGLILVTVTAAAFRFPNEGRGRAMLRTSLVPPPPPPSPPSPPRGIHHRFRGRRVQQHPVSGWRWPPPPPPAMGTGRHNGFPKQPRKLEWQPPVKTLQQAHGYDQGPQSRQTRYIISSPSSSTDHKEFFAATEDAPENSFIMHSSPHGTETEGSSNHIPSLSLTNDEATDLCQRCDLLIHMAASACCSSHGLCCHQQHTPQHSQHPFQHQTPSSNFQLQTPFHPQRNNHQQGHGQVPTHQIFNTESVNFYNGPFHQRNPSTVANEPPYNIRDLQFNNEPEYSDLDYPTDDDIIEQEDSNPVNDRRPSSSLGDFIGGVVISLTSMAVRSLTAGNGLGPGESQREHRMAG